MGLVPAEDGLRLDGGCALEAFHHLSELLMQTHKGVERERYTRSSGPLKVLG